MEGDIIGELAACQLVAVKNNVSREERREEAAT